MYCSQCGMAIGANDKFCLKCGATVSSADEHTTVEPSTPDPSTAPEATTSAFRDPSKLTQWLKYFLYASIAIDLIAVFSGVLQYRLLSDFNLGVYSSQALATAAAESNDNRQQVIGFLRIGILTATIIPFAMWIYRANFNARQLGAQDMQFSPGSSIAYYFIPIFWFWKPYQAMREIWQASKDPASLATVQRGSILPWWWFSFLAYIMLVNFALQRFSGAKEINELIISTGISIAAALLHILAAICALVLVKQIYEMQMSHVQRHI
jgi:hypothetical protein